MKEGLQLKALEAFGRQAQVFDETYGADSLIAYKRKRVRDHIISFLEKNHSLLELNCGTGDDALYFSGLGYRVHATDGSEPMLQKLRIKLRERNAGGLSMEKCSFTQLECLENKGPFDHVYSNFGGLNCTPELTKVLSSLDQLLNPGGYVTLVIINRFCLWESLLFFRGKFRTALRRFFSSSGRTAFIERTQFRCWYFSTGDVIRGLPSYKIISVEGLCTLVPPSYLKDFDKKYPGLFDYLVKKEAKWKNRKFWRNAGDYFMITLQKPG